MREGLEDEREEDEKYERGGAAEKQEGKVQERWGGRGGN